MGSQVGEVLAVILFIAVHSAFQTSDMKRLARNTSPKLPCTTSSGVEWVRTPGNCSKYLVCGFGIPMATLACPNSLVWSLQAKNCVQRGSRWDDCGEMLETVWGKETVVKGTGESVVVGSADSTGTDEGGFKEISRDGWGSENNHHGGSLDTDGETRERGKFEGVFVEPDRSERREGGMQSVSQSQETSGEARWEYGHEGVDTFPESSSPLGVKGSSPGPPHRPWADWPVGGSSSQPSQPTEPWWVTETAPPIVSKATTYRSPFQRWDTTRRRIIVADDGGGDVDNDNHHRGRDNNHVVGESGYEEPPWWQRSWGPRWSTVPTLHTTRRPWWSDEENQIPWLTQSERPDWWPRHDDDVDPSPSPASPNDLSSPDTTTAATTSTELPSPSVTTPSAVDNHPSSSSPTVISWSPPGVADDENGEVDAIWREVTSQVSSMSPWLSTKTYPSDDTWWDSEDVPAYYPECGVAVTNLIVGGLPASEGRWPWVVSLRLTWARRHVCGGTLVHPQWIITAAHCVFGSQFEDATDWRAVFGNVQPTLTADIKLQRKVDLIIRHPEFVNSGNYPNDIAMMRLEKPVDVSGFQIRHACLPSRSKPFMSDSKCWIMGWGETKGYEEQSVLQELEVKIRRNHACAARWGWKRILNSHVCVGNGDEGACNGDSGGPLVCLRDGYYYVVGVTSWGVSGCQTTGYPSVFARVSYYEKWIMDAIHTYSTVEFPLRNKSS